MSEAMINLLITALGDTLIMVFASALFGCLLGLPLGVAGSCQLMAWLFTHSVNCGSFTSSLVKANWLTLPLGATSIFISIAPLRVALRCPASLMQVVMSLRFCRTASIAVSL